MRGKAQFLEKRIISFRIPPAYAGKSDPEVQRRFKKGDHPRLCGEKPSLILVVIGSIGITPAYAGKSTPFGNICQAF